MRTVRIVHTGDLHLDCRFSNLPLEKSKIRRQELKTSFKNALGICGKADIVLIAGDIFDNANFTKDSINFLNGIFEKHPDTTFFISFGNHDCYHSPACEALLRSLPDNAVVFSDKAEYMELDDIKTRVYGMSFSSKYQYESMMNEFEVINDDYINILLLHGDLITDGAQSRYNPISVSQIEKSGFDYVALGHTHDYSGIRLAGNTYYAYCGAPEPHGFDECGDKGVICGEVGKGFCRLAFKSTSIRRYHCVSVDVTTAHSLDDVITMVHDAVSCTDDFYKVTLCGTLNEAVSLETVLIEKSVDAFFVTVTDETRRSYNLDELAQGSGLMAFVARNVLSQLRDCSDDEVSAVCAASDYLFDVIDSGGKR